VPNPCPIRDKRSSEDIGTTKSKTYIPAGMSAAASPLIGTKSSSMATKESETEIVQIVEWSETQIWS
jgi:hypothetical protein